MHIDFVGDSCFYQLCKLWVICISLHSHMQLSLLTVHFWVSGLTTACRDASGLWTTFTFFGWKRLPPWFGPAYLQKLSVPFLVGHGIHDEVKGLLFFCTSQQLNGIPSLWLDHLYWPSSRSVSSPGFYMHFK